MVSSSPARLKTSRYRNYFGKRASLPSALVALCVLILLYVTRKKIASLDSSPRFYSFDIVNEFPTILRPSHSHGDPAIILMREKFTHQMQDGWGLATDGKVILGSDGNSTLYQLDPLTWKVIHRVTVRYDDHEVPFINDWNKQGLLKSGHTDIDILNGIAWDEENNHLFVTGKLWPKLYKIKLCPVKPPLNGKIKDLWFIIG